MKKLLLGILLIGCSSSVRLAAQTWSATSFMGGINPAVKDLQILSPTQFYFTGSIGASGDPRGYIRKVTTFSVSNVNTGFTSLYTTPTSGLYGTNGITSISFVSVTHGWAVWTNLITGIGYVINTTDGGVTWNNQFSLTGGILKICFVNSTHGWFMNNSAIYSTTDGGVTWVAKTNPSASTHLSMVFTDQNTGYVVDAYGQVNKTIDGGTTWSTQTLTGLTGYNEINVYFFNATTGWIVSTGGFIFKTTDAGATWIAQTSGTTQTLRDVCFINANKGFACGDGGTMCSTTDGGTTWTATVIPSSGNFVAMDFYQNYGRALTSFGNMYKYCEAPAVASGSLTLCQDIYYQGQYISGSGTYTFDVNGIGGCVDTAKVTNVTAIAPSIQTTSTQTICLNLPMTPLVLTTNAITSISTVSLPTGLTATYSNNQIIISGTPTATGLFGANFYGYGACNTIGETINFNVTTSGCSTTGVLENQVLNNITLQPNPASTFVTLNNVAEGTTVNVMDVTGKVIVSNSMIDGDKTMTIETSNLSNGIYVIQLKNKGAVAQKKLIISK
jgi:photosystem II stability/assembly factor-like uncharacterized protein